MPDEAVRERLLQALAALDRAIAAAPDPDGAAFSEAVVHLSAARDTAAQQGRGTEPARDRLARMNAILSLILAGHFPLGTPPWGEIRKTRDWLAALCETA